MGFHAKAGGGDRIELPIIPEDTYQAVCIGVCDIGHQKNNFYNPAKKDEPDYYVKPYVHKMFLSFELPGVLIDLPEKEDMHGKPRVISKKYTVSMHQKASLRRDVQALAGVKFNNDAEAEGFDLACLVGANCMIQVAHNESNGKVYANIGGILKLPNGMKELKPVSDTYSYCLDDGAVPDCVPKFMVKMIEESRERHNQQVNKSAVKVANESFDDDPVDTSAGDEIPF